jgi:hypothetical protein
MTDANSKIIDAGAIGAALWNAPDDEAEALGRHYDAAIAGMDDVDLLLTMMVTKLTLGQDYRICTNRPESLLPRCRSLAADLGATLDYREKSAEGWGQAMISLRPAAKQ